MIEVTIQYGCNATNLFLPCKDSAIQAAVEALQPPDTNDRNLMLTDIRGIDSHDMECGSMAGWDAPGADPTFYDFADQGTVSMTMGGL